MILCLRKIERYLNCDSSPGTPWRILSGTVRSRELDRAETVRIFSEVHLYIHIVAEETVQLRNYFKR